MEVRVGNSRPPDSGASSSMMKINSKCISYSGSATTADLILSCGSKPILGRYLTLQRLDDGMQAFGEPLNLVEMQINSVPSPTPSIDVLQLEIPADPAITITTTQCPLNYG